MSFKVGDYVEVTPRYAPKRRLGARIEGLPSSNAGLYLVSEVVGNIKKRDDHKLFYSDEIRKMSKAKTALYKLRR